MNIVALQQIDQLKSLVHTVPSGWSRQDKGMYFSPGDRQADICFVIWDIIM